MTLIYSSPAWEKLNGDDWISGNALYYVARLDDNFGQSASGTTGTPQDWANRAAAIPEQAIPELATLAVIPLFKRSRRSVITEG